MSLRAKLQLVRQVIYCLTMPALILGLATREPWILVANVGLSIAGLLLLAIDFALYMRGWPL
jgi:hypothetical protein